MLREDQNPAQYDVPAQTSRDFTDQILSTE